LNHQALPTNEYHDDRKFFKNLIFPLKMTQIPSLLLPKSIKVGGSSSSSSSGKERSVNSPGFFASTLRTY
jgi:hypothetical protein